MYPKHIFLFSQLRDFQKIPQHKPKIEEKTQIVKYGNDPSIDAFFRKPIAFKICTAIFVFY